MVPGGAGQFVRPHKVDLRTEGGAKILSLGVIGTHGHDSDGWASGRKRLPAAM